MITEHLADLGYATLETTSSTPPGGDFGFNISSEVVMLFAIAVTAILVVVWMMRKQSGGSS